VGHEPAISVAVEFPLDRAGGIVEASQILGGRSPETGRPGFATLPQCHQRGRAGTLLRRL